MPKSRLIISACGDILLGDYYFDIGYGMGSQIKRRDKGFVFKEVGATLSKSDLVLGNLECPISRISNKHGIRKKEFLADPMSVEVLTEGGFDGLSLANNHMLQHGNVAFNNTTQLLARNGIAPIGIIDQEDDKQHLIKYSFEDTTLGVVSYSFAEDHFEKENKSYAFAPSQEILLRQIGEYKKKCDYLILMLHWGQEFVRFPSQFQIELAHSMVEAGVDIILGSHPHVVQGVETYKKSIIAYSLGNFVFSMNWTTSRYSTILQIFIMEDGTMEFELIPIWIDDNFRPTIPNKHLKNRILEYFQRVNDTLYRSYALTLDEYEIMVQSALLQYQSSTRKSFVKNFYKQRPFVIFQLSFEFLNRNLANCFRKTKNG